ncbi:hypothetical protein Henu3_gp91 [Mycobacterium phage Henu3 PeY-2017]|nr:hypothetical protein Henu3_gp91 [Mycobacterium phage Henu3 PeY-2017]
MLHRHRPRIRLRQHHTTTHTTLHRRRENHTHTTKDLVNNARPAGATWRHTNGPRNHHHPPTHRAQAVHQSDRLGERTTGIPHDAMGHAQTHRLRAHVDRNGTLHPDPQPAPQLVPALRRTAVGSARRHPRRRLVALRPLPDQRRRTPRPRRAAHRFREPHTRDR